MNEPEAQQRLLAEITAGGAKLRRVPSTCGDSLGGPFIHQPASTPSSFDAEIRARLADRTRSALSAAKEAINEQNNAILHVKQRLVSWRDAPHASIHSLAQDIESLRQLLSEAGVPGAEHDSWCGSARCPPRRVVGRECLSTNRRNVKRWEQRQLEAITTLVASVRSLEAVSKRLGSDGITKPGRLLAAVKSAKSVATRAELSFEAPGLAHAVVEVAPATATTDPLLATASSYNDDNSFAGQGSSPPPPPPPPPPPTASPPKSSGDEPSPTPIAAWRLKQRKLAKIAAEERKAAIAAADSADQLVASAVAHTATTALNATCRCLEQALDKYDGIRTQQPEVYSDAGSAEARLDFHIRAENCRDALMQALEALTVATSTPLCADTTQCGADQLTRQARLTLRKLAADVARRDVALREQDQEWKTDNRGLWGRQMSEDELKELEQLQCQRLERARSSASGRGWGQFDPRATPNFELRGARTNKPTGVYAAPVRYRAVEGRTTAAVVLQRYVRGYQARRLHHTALMQQRAAQTQPPSTELQQVVHQVEDTSIGSRPARADLIGEHEVYWEELERLRCYQPAAMKYITTLRKAIAENNALVHKMDAADAAGRGSPNGRTNALQKTAYFASVLSHCTDFSLRCNDTSESYQLDPDIQALQKMGAFLKGIVHEPQ